MYWLYISFGITPLITFSRSAYDQLLKESDQWYKFGKYISDCLLIKKCRRGTSFLMENAYESMSYCLKLILVSNSITFYLGIKSESLSMLKSFNLG